MDHIALKIVDPQTYEAYQRIAEQNPRHIVLDFETVKNYFIVIDLSDHGGWAWMNERAFHLQWKWSYDHAPETFGPVVPL